MKLESASPRLPDAGEAPRLKGPRVAIVHDWLLGMRGGERLLESLLKLFPAANLYTLFYRPEGVSDAINRRSVTASGLNRLPGVHKYYRYILPVLPKAIESLRLGGEYDLVLASSHCVAHGVRTAEGTRRVTYCHSPMRYLYDQSEAYERGGLGLGSLGLRLAGPGLRRWDKEAALRHPDYIANSEFVARRIERVYGIQARVVHPPVRSDFFTPGDEDKCGALRADVGSKTRPAPELEPEARIQRLLRSFKAPPYLVVSALAPYKRVDLAIAAANRLGRELLVVGSGQAERRLRQMAGPTVRFAGWVNDLELRECYRACAALIFPGEEDFGITPLEAMACGKPVLGLGSGGLLETVKEGLTGRFFENPDPERLAEAWREFDPKSFDPVAIRAHAETFSGARYLREMAEALNPIFTPG